MVEKTNNCTRSRAALIAKTDAEGREATAPHAKSWAVENLSKGANSVSVSRRTDIPAPFGKWFSHRLKAGYAEYVTARSRQRYRCSLRPADVRHFAFWTKNPKPFLPVLAELLEIGYPMLWNVTITGLGGTKVEPYVPSAKAAMAAVRQLAQMVPPSAIMWRYDPLFLSELYGQDFHVETFTRLAGELAGHVDRIAVSFLGPCYARRVQPDLKLYETEAGDRVDVLPLAQQVDLIGNLHDIALGVGLQLTLCCSPELQHATGYPATGCNSFVWARRVYPALERAKSLKPKPTREGCACDDERDIGAYDTCILGCRYSYGSSCRANALANFKRHDPLAPCLIPADSPPAARAAGNTELPIIASSEESCGTCDRKEGDE